MCGRVLLMCEGAGGDLAEIWRARKGLNQALPCPGNFCKLPTPPAPEKKPPLPQAAGGHRPRREASGVAFQALNEAARPPGKRGKKGEPTWKAGARALRKDRRRQP